MRLSKGDFIRRFIQPSFSLLYCFDFFKVSAYLAALSCHGFQQNRCLSTFSQKEIQGICIGDGPVDAAFLAIEQIIGYHYELDDFQIQSVTEGKEAMGSALVKLRAGGKLYSGNGLSTDIIGASIRAYLNAVNKIVYEEA